MAKNYHPIDPKHVHGRVFYIRVKDGEVSILNDKGQKSCIVLKPNEKSRVKYRNVKPYYYLRFTAGGHIRDVGIAFLVMATFKHKIPDRSKGEVIDHIDGDTLNNNPSNLRIVTRKINDRDAGFMRKMRNNGYPVAKFPGIILEGYERMALWKAEHTEWQYENLKGRELLKVFLGPNFPLCTPDSGAEPRKYADPFIEN